MLTPFESYLNKDGLLSIAEDFYNQAMLDYTSTWNEEPDKETKNWLRDYMTALVILTLFGWDQANFDGLDDRAVNLLKQQNSMTDSTEVDKSYSGVDQTTERILENEVAKVDGNALALDIDKMAKNRAEVLFEALAIGLYQTIVSQLSITAGYNFARLQTQRDNRVRPRHRLHDGKIVNLDEYNPLRDFGCRCFITERFRTLEEAMAAGYQEIKKSQVKEQMDRLKEIMIGNKLTQKQALEIWQSN